MNTKGTKKIGTTADNKALKRVEVLMRATRDIIEEAVAKLMSVEDAVEIIASELKRQSDTGG
jgi:hypothetical protein